MSYLAPIHRPTSVKHAIKLSLLHPQEECLVLAKSNRLEVYEHRNDGLLLVYSRTLYGKIFMLEKLRPRGSTTDHLFVGTDRFVYFTASWDPQLKQLRTEQSYVDQADKSARDSATHDRCLIDPSNQFMALFLHNGIVSILPLSSSKGKRKGGSNEIDWLGDPIPTRISLLSVRSSVFLHPKPGDKKDVQLAVLYEDSHQKVCLSVRVLDYLAGGSGEPGFAELETELGFHDDIELGASHLIAVPGPTYGFLVLAETEIMYYNGFDDNNSSRRSLAEATQFVAWATIDDIRWLLADDFGNLYLLMLLIEDALVAGWQLDKIGQTSRASALVYLDDGYVFVGSHQGDSQVVKIEPQGIQIVQIISNIAPILDFTVMDMGSRAGGEPTNEYSSGQARIVTGSGVFADGSLRSVRSGVGLEEQGVLGEMDNATDIFALRSLPTALHDDILIVSFINETRIVRFSANGDVEEQAEFKSLKLCETTLTVSNLHNGRVVQVTPSCVRLIDFVNGMVLDEWSAPQSQPITSASTSQAELMISLNGSEVAAFSLSGDITLKSRKQLSGGQIACVHVTELVPGIGFVAFWHELEIAIVNTRNLDVLRKEKITDDLSSVARSILVERLLPSHSQEHATLLISAVNGEVMTFSIDLKTYELSSRSVTVLGTQQAKLKAIPRGDGLLVNIFATCEHPSLIYGSDDRIVFSAVTAETATSVCPFDSELYPKAVAIATNEDIRIALVDTEKTTHVQTLHIGELVRRIAYSTSLKAFGIGTVHRQLQGTEERVTSRFKLADEVLFKELDTFDLNEDELVESVIRADICEDDDDVRERFIVGTTYVDEEQDDAVRGRILVFAVTGERKLRLITELPVKGACRALGCLDGKIVAALVKTVVIYSLRSSRLQKLCAYRTSTAPIDIAIDSHRMQIAVADLMKSVSIVTYIPPNPSKTKDDRHRLVESARHFQTAWSTSVAKVGDQSWLESDAEGNLMVLSQDQSALSEDDKRRLRLVSHIRLGEMVNRIRPISIRSLPEAPVAPKAFMATVDGGVYLFGQIGQDFLDLLISLQSALAPMVTSLGNVPFNSYRAFRNQVMEATEPMRFVDGELVERFLELPTREQERIVDGLGVIAKSKGGLHGLRGIIESLRRLH